MSKLPEGYSLPLRSREEIAQYLVYGKGQPWYSTRQPRADRDSQGLFCFNVKVYNLDLSLEHLMDLYEKNGHGTPKPYWADERWLKQVRQEHSRIEERLYDWAIEEARETVNDTDSWKCLWWFGDDAYFDAAYDFVGRSGGWLRLQTWGTRLPDGFTSRYDFTTGDQDYWYSRIRGNPYRKGTADWQDYEYGDPSLTWYEVRKLYATTRMLEWDFQADMVKAAVEDAACFRLFSSFLEEIEDPRLPGWQKSECGASALAGPRSGW